jgi:hypothetical protein
VLAPAPFEDPFDRVFHRQPPAASGSRSSVTMPTLVIPPR